MSMQEPSWVKFHQHHWHKVQKIHGQIVMVVCGRNYDLDMCMTYWGEEPPSCQRVCLICQGLTKKNALT